MIWAGSVGAPARDCCCLGEPCVQAVNIDIIPIEAQAADLAAGTIRLTEVGENARRKAEIIPIQIIAWRREDGQSRGPRRLDAILRIFDGDTRARVAPQRLKSEAIDVRRGFLMRH